MIEIKRLSLVNFRNYISLDISFNKKINIFLGNNAQGKTTLLESIYLLAISKSHKTFKDKDLIKFNESFCKVTTELTKDQNQLTLNVVISNEGKKVLVNQVEKRKTSEYIGVFNVVMFAPEDLEIVKGEPINRRKFIDIEIGQISSIYIFDLNQYNRILKQRNEYLKQISQTQKIDYAYLDTITEQLSFYGAKITSNRIKFINKLNKFARNLQKYISSHQEDLYINYLSNYQLKDNINQQQIFQLYKKNYQRDIIKGVTKLGIHKDDIRFIVNDIDVSNFGSQGQQRTTALAIKLALIDFVKEETNHYPIVLLDDVLSELDDNRQTQLLDCIKDKCQTFVTSTNISGIKKELIDKSDIFVIENARITKEKGEKYGKQ